MENFKLKRGWGGGRQSESERHRERDRERRIGRQIYEEKRKRGKESEIDR